MFFFHAIGRDDQVVQPPADGFFSGKAKNGFRALIPTENLATAGDCNHRLGRLPRRFLREIFLHGKRFQFAFSLSLLSRHGKETFARPPGRRPVPAIKT
jgi:hypothetical protein